MKLKELTNEEFKNFSYNFKNKSIFQTVQYGLTMADQGYDSIFLGLIDNNNILAASLILITKQDGFKYAYSPKGFLIDYNDTKLLNIFTSKIKSYLNKKDVIAIRINPMIIKDVYDRQKNVIYHNKNYNNIYKNLIKLGYHHLGYNNFFENIKPRFEAVLDISLPYQEIFKNISKNYRTKIRSSEKQGVKIYKSGFNNLDYLYLQAKNKYPRDKKYFENIYKFFNRDNMVDFYYAKLDTKDYLINCQKNFQVFENTTNNLNNKIIENSNTQKKANDKLINKKMANDKLFDKVKHNLIKATNLLKNNPNGIVLASLLVIKKEQEIYLLMDGYNKKYNWLNAKHLLLWKIIEQYSKEGFKKFNLGGLSNIFMSENKYTGLNYFKMSFGCNAFEYIGDLELITHNTLYFMYNNTAPIRKLLKK